MALEITILKFHYISRFLVFESFDIKGFLYDLWSTDRLNLIFNVHDSRHVKREKYYILKEN